MRSSVSADVQTLLEVFKKNEQLFLLARPTTIEGGPLVSREPFPLFFKLFLLGEQSEKNDGLSCVALAVGRVCVSGL